MSLTDRKLVLGKLNLIVVGSVLTLLVACRPAEEAVAPEIRPVRVVTIESGNGGDSVSLTGRVQAESEVNLAFRIDGRMISRAVNVGDTVTAGQEIARLNPENEENGLRAAEATLQGARGQLIEARANEAAQPFAAGAELHLPGGFRSDHAGCNQRPGAGRRSAGAGQHRPQSARLHATAGRCRWRGDGSRRRTR